jgi:hypothetical protein
LGGAFATTAKADGHGHGHHGHHHHGHYHHYSRPSYGVYCAPAPYSTVITDVPGYYSIPRLLLFAPPAAAAIGFTPALDNRTTGGIQCV